MNSLFVKLMIFLLGTLLFMDVPGSIYNYPDEKPYIADSIYQKAKDLQEIGNYAESSAILQHSLDRFIKMNSIIGVAECYKLLATNYYYLGNYDKALQLLKLSEKNYRKAKDKKGVSSTLNNQGGIYYFLGNYPKAINHYNRAMELQKQIGDIKAIAQTNQNIGAIYSRIGEYADAQKYYRNSLNIYESLKDEKSISQGLNALGFVFIKLKMYSAAEKNLKEAFLASQKINNIQLQTEVLSNLGALYFDKGDYKNALYYYKKCLENSGKIQNLQFISDSQVGIGRVHLANKNFKSAVQNCTDGLKLAYKLGALSLKKDACDCLYEAYKVNGNAKLALEFFEKSNILKDSLQSEETANKIMSMEFENKKLLDSIAYVNKEHTLQLKHKEEVQQKEKQRNAIIVSLGMILLLSGGLYSRLNFVKKSKKALQYEKDRSDKLLLNILPEEIAEELKEKGAVNARNFNLVTVLFSDFKSFTQTAEKMSPVELVEEINVCFKAFDHISEKFNVEKIKTIGDSYMAVGGIPAAEDDYLANTVFAALEMQQFMIQRKAENDMLGKPAFEMRIGIHAGPIVAGVVGVKKFQYDVWGDAVNTASRIESNGTVGKVNISEALYKLLKSRDSFSFQYRGKIHAKGKGDINMYYVDIKESSPTLKAVAQEAQTT